MAPHLQESRKVQLLLVSQLKAATSTRRRTDVCRMISRVCAKSASACANACAAGAGAVVLRHIRSVVEELQIDADTLVGDCRHTLVHTKASSKSNGLQH